ncbi:restriction endonuclease subunit S, partial [Planctomycetota bacterium]
MSGRKATTSIIPGKYALSVGRADMPTPSGWEWFLLTDVARLETGHTPSRQHPEYWDGGDIHWIGIKDARIHHGKTIQETLQRVTQLGIDNSASRLLPSGTVCLSRTASVGYALIMGREMATSQDFVNWVCTDALQPEFLMYALMAEKDSLLKFGKGTTHTTIYFPEVKALNVCLPPKPEQKRIVAKIEELFSDLDAGVSALERARANLRRYRASVLKSAVEGRLTKKWGSAN